MVRIELAPEVAEDFERILEHLQAFEVADPDERVDEIIAALDILEQNPLIGRPLPGGSDAQLRALIIGRGSRGYVALYSYLPELETVFILAMRSQREAGYART
jgi:plasmid stabilization system protein ParE